MNLEIAFDRIHWFSLIRIQQGGKIIAIYPSNNPVERFTISSHIKSTEFSQFMKKFVCSKNLKIIHKIWNSSSRIPHVSVRPHLVPDSNDARSKLLVHFIVISQLFRDGSKREVSGTQHHCFSSMQ